jgi:hypothetical protein
LFQRRKKEQSTEKEDVNIENNKSQRVDRVENNAVGDADLGGLKEPEGLEALLKDPPVWLAEQLTGCQRDPALIRPTCSAIAYEIYGTSSRWEEVKPAVNRWLEDAGGKDLEGLEDLYEEDR